MPRASTRWEIRLLHSFAVRHNGGHLSLGPSAEKLVALLAIEADPCSRCRAAGELWPECPDARAHANLRSLLHRLANDVRNLVVATDRRLALAEDVAVDLHAASAAAERIVSGRPARTDLSSETLRMLGADLLPEWYEDWLVSKREAYRHVRLHALEIACRILSARRRHSEAVAVGIRVVNAEPLRESAHRALISAHLLEGNYNEAAKQYETCQLVLERELSVGPSFTFPDLTDREPRAPRSTALRPGLMSSRV